MANERESSPVLDAVEGTMQVLQILLMTLAKTSQLDTAEYARQLADWRWRPIRLKRL